jgi:hypothetical protein
MQNIPEAKDSLLFNTRKQKKKNATEQVGLRVIGYDLCLEGSRFEFQPGFYLVPPGICRDTILN